MLALLRSMPRSLEAAGLPLPLARRVWTTALTAATMRTMDVHWAVNAPGFFGMGPVGDGTPETLLDRAEAWLAEHVPPELAARIDAAAARKVALWKAVQDQRVTAMRRAELHTLAHATTVLQRTAGEVVRAVLTTHQTFSIFLTPYLDALRRWQGFMALISSILAVLLVNIWMYFSRSLNCCLEARAFLGCSAVTSEPCHAFTGDCADILTSFEGVVFDEAPGVPPDYVCLAFPNDDSFRDSIILGLISWACSLPVPVFILNCFWCANSFDYDASWLRWDFQRRMLLGRANWRYKPSPQQQQNSSGVQGDSAPPPPKPPPGFVRRLAATAWGVNVWYNLEQGLIERPVAWGFARENRARVRRGQPRIEDGTRLAAGMQTQIKMQQFAVIGVLATYVIWAVMTWIIFTYGALVYRMMGDAAQQKFAQGWAIGLAISQATQCKDMIIVALQSAAVMTILDSLWLVR
jgi:hypothetical protein